MKKTILSVTVSALLTACGGAGPADPPAVVQPPINYSAETSTPVRFGTYNYFDLSKYSGSELQGYRQVLAAIDVNGDGYDDIILSPMFLQSVAKPVVLFFNPTAFQFEINQQFQSVVPAMQHPREVAMVDFDGDGRKDLFIADHGYDDAPWGAQNVLILNKTSGFENATQLLPQYSDYTHGIVVADFWLTGRESILTLNTEHITKTNKCQAFPEIKSLVCAPGAQQPRSYVLENTGSNIIPIRTLSADINFSVPSNDPSRLMKGVAADLNNDRVPDMVLAYIGKAKIIESTSIGQYKTSAEFFPNRDFVSSCQYPADIAYGNVSVLDLDNDGSIEVLTYYTCSWNNMQWQVLKKNAVGVWQDVTSRYIPDQSANRLNPAAKNWCLDIYHEDINGDGFKDIVCRSYYTNMFWKYDTNTGSYKIYTPNLTYPDGNLVNGMTNPLILTLGNTKYLISARDILLGTVFVGWRIK